MIKFFKRIRQNLLISNQLNKYLIYAFGEITLVVLGILIALQINTWNENRKNIKALNFYLNDILINLVDDASMNAFYESELLRINKETKLILDHNDLNSFHVDSLENYITNIYEILQDYSDTEYKRISEAGIIKYGAYEYIMSDISNYYKMVIPNMRNHAHIFNESIRNEKQYWLFEQQAYEFNLINDIKNSQIESIRKSSLVELLKLPRSRNILKVRYQKTNIYLNILKKRREKTWEIVEKLRNALESNGVKLKIKF